MDIQVKVGALQDQAVDAIIVTLFENTNLSGPAHTIDQKLDGAVRALIDGGDITGKAGQVAVLYPGGAIPARRVIVVGQGKEADFSADVVRRVLGTGARKARELGAQSVASALPSADALDAEAAVEGAMLGLYKWRGLKTDEDTVGEIDSLTLLVPEEGKRQAAQAGAKVGQAIAEGTCLTRDLVNNPANIATPTMLAETAQDIATRFGMRIEVLDRAAMEELGMGALLGVARGTHEPPKFIILEYNADADADTIVLVGKGVTFDTGGISLKPGKNMGLMKTDMAGAGAVLGTMYSIGALGLPLHVVGLAPATDNMPGGSAYKPGDVVTALNGKTIEIISTDAEGRMLLADALSYAERFEPNAVIDLATLTGACVVALGLGVAAGLFCEDDELRAQLEAASAASGERLWRMPMFPEYTEALKSDSADIKNGGERYSGVGFSAAFLHQFAEGYPWAHLDIASMAYHEKDLPYYPKGATGFGVRVLVQMLRNWHTA